MYQLDMMACLRFAHWEVLWEPVPQIRLHYVSGGAIHLEARLLSDKPLVASDQMFDEQSFVRHEPDCIRIAVRAERERMVDANLFGAAACQRQAMRDELDRHRFTDGSTGNLRRNRSRARAETIAVDDLCDQIVCKRLSFGDWVVLRLSSSAYLAGGADSTHAGNDDGNASPPVIPHWAQSLIDWVDAFAYDWLQQISSLTVDVQHPLLTPESSLPEWVMEPFEFCRGEVLWLTDDLAPFLSEMRMLRDAGIRVRAVRHADDLLDRLDHPDLITIIMPAHSAIDGPETLNRVRSTLEARLDNHRIVAWVSDCQAVGKRRKGISLCRRTSLLATIGEELFRPRYRIHPLSRSYYSG